MASIRVEVGTEDSGENSAYIHKMDQQEGQSMVDLMYDAVEASMLLYNSDGVKSICLYIEE